MFDVPLPAPAGLAKLPEPTGDGPEEPRARAYLHANCSICHRPGGIGGGPADFRFANSFSGVGVCNVVPEHGDLGVVDARLITPGAPERSILSLRMHDLGQNRMPPLATRKVEAAGVEVVDDWIRSLTGCP
jgi:hypothetical protein